MDSAKNKVRAEYSHRLITAYKVFTGEEPNPTEVQFLDVLARRCNQLRRLGNADRAASLPHKSLEDVALPVPADQSEQFALLKACNTFMYMAYMDGYKGAEQAQEGGENHN